MCQIPQHFPFFRPAVKAKLELAGNFLFKLLPGTLSQRNRFVLIDSSFLVQDLWKHILCFLLKKKKNPLNVKIQILNTNFSDYYYSEQNKWFGNSVKAGVIFKHNCQCTVWFSRRNLTWLAVIRQNHCSILVSKLQSVGVCLEVKVILMVHTGPAVVCRGQNENSPSLPGCSTMKPHTQSLPHYLNFYFCPFCGNSNQETSRP